MPAFYARPGTVEEIVTWSAARLLDQVGIHTEATHRWDGEMEAGIEP
jgi:3-polyprenyl-4-hydroxybenzoate decarboxylase